MERGARGSKGGRTTFERYGPRHMAEIGARGFAATVARHWQGDRQGCLDWLRARAHEKRIDAFVDRELQRRLDNGGKTVCEELPVLSDPDDLPF
jgi:hypothetical protein